ncbi:MAG: NAD(+)/NADH kinase [Firmicutes bacterium]|nr:NAD(+)/NADH kinase [Bacillota bacterium]
MKPSEFAIFVNSSKDPDGRETRSIVQFLEQHGCRAGLLPDPDGIRAEDAFKGIPQITREQAEKADMAIVLGGDGTILSGARYLHGSKVPLFGINLGHLGFITACEKDNCLDRLGEVLEGRFTVESRVMIRGQIRSAHSNADIPYCGLNDITITRGNWLRMLQIEVRINGTLMDVLQADGMIIATPTGSTGYTLAAGGPIIVPDAQALVLTPICPKTLTMPSIVMSGQDKVSFRILFDGSELEQPEFRLVVDGQEELPVQPGDIVEAEMEADAVRLVQLEDADYYDTLRRKMFREDV